MDTEEASPTSPPQLLVRLLDPRSRFLRINLAVLHGFQQPEHLLAQFHDWLQSGFLLCRTVT
jgi:hypothetical protein